jgi:hypothetical protein
MIKALITVIAFLLISVSLANAGTRCAKQVGNVCLAPNKGERIAVMCCCRVGGGGMCCAEQATCFGNFVTGCFCTGYNDEPQVTRVSTKPSNE